MSNFEIIILLFSLSIDLFFVGLSFGINKINITMLQNLFLNLIGTMILVLTFIIGKNLTYYFLNFNSYPISASIFIVLGIIKLANSLKSILHQKNRIFHIRYKTIEIRLQIFKQSFQPDYLIHQHMSYRELILLAVLLSIDNIIAGIGIGLLDISFPLLIVMSFSISFVFLYTSNYIGSKISVHIPKNRDWISGIILILIGLLNI